MILFSQEKEIVFKLTNAVLLLWLIAATAFFSSNVIDILLKEPTRDLTYEEYRLNNCPSFKEDTSLSEEEREARCQFNYNEQNYYKEREDFNKYRNLYVSLANAVIVGSVMFFINKDKKEVK